MELESSYIVDMSALIVHICNQMWVKFIDLWQTCFELHNTLPGHLSNQRIDVMHKLVSKYCTGLHRT